MLHDAAQASLLEAAAHVCQKDPLFLAQLGLLLNRAGRYADAAEHLERALMLQPALKDAQLSYAIALTGLGDLDAAQALVADLLQDPALPAPLRATLGEQYQALQRAQSDKNQSGVLASALAAAAAGWQSRFTLGGRVGFDSNLLGAPNLESLTLTFSGQTLDLPLDESYLARAGSYTRVEAQWDLRRVEASGALWNALAALRSRNSPELGAAGSTQLDLSLERSHTPGLLGHYINIGASQLQPQTGTRYAAASVAAGWAGAWQTGNAHRCQARLGLDAQYRHYADGSVLSGSYKGWSAAASCDAQGGAQWSMGLRHGRDAAQDSARPGGDQDQASLRISALLPTAGIVAQSVLLLSYEYATQQDSTGYSVYIDSNRSRNLLRQATRVEWQLPAGRSAQWVLGADWLEQRSNLPLFGQQSWGANLGYRLGW